jgi:hypothetical protein
MAKQRYVRPDDVLDDDAVLVVRGGDLDRAVLRDDAERMFSVYGVYGISVFALRDVSLDELAQQPPLVRFARLTLVTVGVLRRAGLQLEATGRNPHHFTVGFRSLDDGVERLCACEHRTSDNPYHED